MRWSEYYHISVFEKDAVLLQEHQTEFCGLLCAVKDLMDRINCPNDMICVRGTVEFALPWTCTDIIERTQKHLKHKRIGVEGVDYITVPTYDRPLVLYCIRAHIRKEKEDEKVCLVGSAVELPLSLMSNKIRSGSIGSCNQLKHCATLQSIAPGLTTLS